MQPPVRIVAECGRRHNRLWRAWPGLVGVVGVLLLGFGWPAAPAASSWGVLFHAPAAVRANALSVFRGRVTRGAGDAVVVQRRAGGRWLTLVSGHTDRRGRFVLTVAAPAVSGRLIVRAFVPQVQAASETRAVRVLRPERSYQARQIAGGFALQNPRQHITARLGVEGLDIRSGDAVLGLRLSGYGYGDTLHNVRAVAPQVDADRIVYRRGALTEWYANEPGGLEQSFTLASPPMPSASGLLTLSLVVAGDVRARLSRRQDAVVFQGAGRSFVYRGLLATDALGKALPARIELNGRRLLLRIDDRGARYPVLIDPTIQASLTAPYPSSVLADHPTAYYRFDETSGLTGFDSSGNGLDGTYATGTQLGVAGALLSESDPAVGAPGRGLVFDQSGDQLPNANKPRTLEAWLDYGCCNGAFTLMQYGDVAGGNGFSVSIGDSGGSIAVSAGIATVSAPTIGDFAHGWHMVDVSYDGSNVEIYEDGQIIGGGQLGTLATAVPGQGFQVGANTGGMGLDEVAVYPAALTPERIDAHWSAGANDLGIAACAVAPTAPYAKTIIADQPLAYYRLGELSSQADDRVAFDSSPNCTNAAYVGHPSSAPGGLPGDPDAAEAAGGRGITLSQSGDSMPAGKASRTFEAWVDYGCCNGAFTLMQYGDVAGGNGFSVSIGDSGGSIAVSAGTATFSAGTIDDFAHGWHMIDVSYEGTTGNVEIYQDGQVIGGGTLDLGATGTVIPGQGLELGANTGGMGIDEVAIFGAALSPEQVDAHWSAGQADLGIGPCAAAPSAPYAKVILADAPTVYYRLDDASVGSQDGLALDFSSHCDNAAYEGHPTPATGTLAGDPDPATGAGGRNTVLIQSGDQLPAVNAARTFEAWVDYGCCNGAFTLFQYGDVAGGHGFSVSIGDSGSSISVTAGGSSVSAATVSDFAHGWHMVDVTYDGSTVEIYQDGQVIGGGSVGAANTVVPGQGLELNSNTAGMGLDEMAVYPTVLSSQKVNAHWEAQYLTPPGESLIAGTASIGGGGAAQGARVQACPASGAPCQVDANPVDSSGAFHMLVSNDTYTITIFPPTGSPSGPQTITNVTVPPNALNLRATFSPPGGLPPGATFSSPSGTQQNVVPTVNWGVGSTYTINACKNGFGFLTIASTNTQTGQPETQAVPLLESPSGSGTYVAQIPPLAPMHGDATVNQSIACGLSTSLFPNGGTSAGGDTVLISGTGFTGATNVLFGSTPASSFTVLDDNLIRAVAPPGTGAVVVSVSTASGRSSYAGTFTYFDVTGLSVGAGPAQGGTTVDIQGSGFTNVTGVMFGLLPATSFTVISPTEVQAVSPIGVGTDDVQVVNGLAISRPASSAQFIYQGGPPGSSAINEGTTPDAQSVLATQEMGYFQASAVGDACANLPDFCSELAGAADDVGGIVVDSLAGSIVITPLTVGISALICDGPCAAFAFAATPIVVFAFDLTKFLCENSNSGLCGLFHMFIDPSGTVVDTKGNPISGATATLLQGSAGGAFSPVDPSGGAIQPATNPEVTGSSGAFEWNALAGTYEVEASAPGCQAPDDSSPNAFTSPFAIPPPAVGLLLTLACPGSAPPTPSVTGLSVSAGPASGGNTVEVTGAGLAGATAVHFGANAVTRMQVLSPYAISAVAPAGSGKVDVRVTTPGGTSAASSVDDYAYVASPTVEGGPTISSVAPASGAPSGGTLVTITGSNLGGAFAVEFGGTPSTQVTNVSPTEVQAVAPAAQFPVRVDIAVTTSGGSSAQTAADIFAYGSPPPPPVPTVSVSASPNPAIFLQRVTLKATVSPTDGGGTAAFYDGGSTTPISGCSALALTLNDGTYEATCSTSALSPGDHTITGAYSGDSSYASNTGMAPVPIIGVPLNTSPPSISGITTQGQKLTETHGTWTNGPTSYSYQWQDCDTSGSGCVDITSATSQTYTLSASDVGQTIRVKESATNAAGTGAPAISGVTADVATPGQTGPPVNSVPPVISGTTTVGQHLSASTGVWSGATPMTFAFQWQLCKPGCASITGALGSSYKLVAGDMGAKVRVVVTASNSSGSAAADSAQARPVGPNAAEVKASLSRLLLPRGEGAKIQAVLKAGGYTFLFTTPSGGHLVISWYFVPNGGHLAKAKEPELVAAAGVTFHQASKARVKLTLTRKGRALLNGTKQLKLTTKATFTPAGGAALVERKTFSLRR